MPAVPLAIASPRLLAEKRLLDQVCRLHALTDDWDGYSTPAPDDGAISYAGYLIHRILTKHHLEPTKAVPSGRGGVAIYFSNHDGKFADLQCPNSGAPPAVPEPVVVLSDGRKKRIRGFAFDPKNVDAVDAAIETIEEFIYS